MSKKNNIDNGEVAPEEDLISRHAIDVPDASRGAIIPIEAAQRLANEVQARGGQFALPKIVLDEFLGFEPNVEKNRATTYTRKLNAQHSKFGTWKIGTNSGKFYLIFVE